MARIKVPPRVAQPDLLLQPVTLEAQTMSSAIFNCQIAGHQVSDDEVNHNTEKQVIPKEATITGSEQPDSRELARVGQIVLVKPRAALRYAACPTCHSEFPHMAIQEFREHVESCSRPVTGDSESAASSLSPPPESQDGNNGDDDDSYLDHLKPYVAGEYTSYPEIKGDSARDGYSEMADSQARSTLPKITDYQKFIDSLEDMEDLEFGVAFTRLRNAAEATIQWQNEWMDLDRFIELIEPAAAPAKPHKNPRIPKDSQIGIGYRDELESHLYGFEYQYHQTKIGKQNPARQRYTNSLNGGRELRQRVPTQKAAEADLSTSPDSDDGIGTRRRGRGQKLREGTADIDSTGGRGQRGRNASRIDSQSRDQTPTSTFPSGKKRGRPAKPKVGVASRLQELQREEGYEYDTTPEPSQDQNMTNFAENHIPLIRNRSYGLHDTVETTETWQDDTDQDDTDQDDPTSRPGTSDSTMTGPSDDMRNPPARSSGRARKRQNTSDFEDALPSHKRIRKANNTLANGFSDLDLAQSTKDTNNAEKARHSRRGRLEEENSFGKVPGHEAILSDSTSRALGSKDVQGSSGSGFGNATQKSQNGKERKIITLKTSSGMPLTPANSMMARSLATDHPPGTSAQQDSKDGPKVSRASLNMMRRWAAKKQAEALGLPVPKIGRYPKGGSVPSTPDVIGVPEPSNSPKPFSGRKRKRDEEELNTANVGVSDTVAAAVEARVAAKKRSGRPKKAVGLEPPIVESTGQQTLTEGAQTNTSSSTKADVDPAGSVTETAPRKKGGRPRKQPLKIRNPLLDVQDGPEQTKQTSVDGSNSHDAVDSTEAEALRQNIESKNEDLASAPLLLRRTTRVRRQTSAALSASSQSNTQHSSRSSQKSTVTPTPAPTQQPSEETVIKQETVNGSTLSRKRGRQPKPLVMGTSPEATVIATNVEDEAPARKRRRVGPATRAPSAESTPAVSEEEGPSLTDEATAVPRPGHRKGKAPTPDALVPEVHSDGQAASAEPLLSRKRARKAPNAEIPVTDAISTTPGSSAEPFVIKQKGGRLRKNVNGGVSAVDVSVKAEDTTRLPDPLTTRARSSGRDITANANLTEEEFPMGRQITKSERHKKKGSWGGKRIKGVFSSGAALNPAIASNPDANSRTAETEEQSHFNMLSSHEPVVEEGPKKGPLMGTRSKNTATTAVTHSTEIGEDTVHPAPPSNALFRNKRAISKAATIGGEVGSYGADPEVTTQPLSRPKRAIAITEVSGREGNSHDVSQGAPSGPPPRSKRVITPSVITREAAIDETALGASPNVLPRSKKVAPLPMDHEADERDTGTNDTIPESSTRIKRITTMKISTAGVLAPDNAETISNIVDGTESVGSDSNKNNDKRKNMWAGQRAKAAKTTENAADEGLPTKVESENEDSDSDETNMKKKLMAAKVAKAMKNSQSMKARWANGSMHEVMRKKRESNIAKKAAAAQSLAAAATSTPASAPSKRKVALSKAVSRAPKRRRTMDAAMDGPADTEDEYDIPEASFLGPVSPISRKASEHEYGQQLSSPLRSAHSSRKRRSAALRASQSFSKFADDGNDGEEADMVDDEDENVETELKKQFDSEYEHFRPSSPPPYRGLQWSNVIPGKRKPKPVINLAEAMRIEAGDEDDFFIGDE